MAASLAQGGPRPNFLREWCYLYLCSGDSDNLQVSESDVMDSDLTSLLDKVKLLTGFQKSLDTWHDQSTNMTCYSLTMKHAITC